MCPTCVLLPFALTLPLAAAPATLPAQSRTQQRHNPAPAKALCKAAPGTRHHQTAGVGPGAAAWPCNKAVPPCGSVLCKEIIQSIFLFKHTPTALGRCGIC